ncbi:MAG: amidohydrolase family protein [Aurantibacter sp.]
MKKLILLLTLVFAISCNNNTAQEVVSPTATLISDVNIVDIKSGAILENRQVVIDSGKIKSISEILENKKGYSQTINGKGKYLMPGLAEMHAHIPPPSTDAKRIEEVLFLYLSNGITTIRGMLGDPAHLELREKAEHGEILSPRIFTSSPSINGNSVTTPQEATEKVTAYQKEGYDFLKIHPGVKLDVFDQLVKTANEVGIPFAGHVPVDVGIRHALTNKYASIDHVDGFLEGLVPESANVKPNENGFFGYNFTDLADASKIDELVAMAKENEVWIVPTQSLFTKWFAPTSADEVLALPEMKYMPVSTLENWKQRKKQSTGEGSGFDATKWEKFDALRKQLIKKLQDNGHGMLLGSDAPQLFNVPGFSIHKEMEDMADAGMTNLEIIQSGTINPAKYFNMSAVFGEVKVGMDADLILVDGDPLENLGALQNVSGVLRQGNWWPKEAIEAKLVEIAKNAADK